LIFAIVAFKIGGLKSMHWCWMSWYL
jgi:hypothetical protein